MQSLFQAQFIEIEDVSFRAEAMLDLLILTKKHLKRCSRGLSSVALSENVWSLV